MWKHPDFQCGTIIITIVDSLYRFQCYVHSGYLLPSIFWCSKETRQSQPTAGMTFLTCGSFTWKRHNTNTGMYWLWLAYFQQHVVRQCRKMKLCSRMYKESWYAVNTESGCIDYLLNNNYLLFICFIKY